MCVSITEDGDTPSSGAVTVYLTGEAGHYGELPVGGGADHPHVTDRRPRVGQHAMPSICWLGI